METLTRKGMLDDKTYGLIDNLTYGYNGNQVVKITDKVQGPYYKDAMHFVDGANAATEYKYNKNGCMTQDLNKNILEIDYNLLNLPTKVTFSDGSIIAYGYDADGARLSADYNLSLMNVMKGNNGATQAGGTVKHHRDYCGNYIYEDGALKMLLFDGGYVSFDANNSPKYHFYLKDHLGNNRVVADANGNIEQVNHYYPFGGLMAESKGDVQPYKYNGKELDRMHGLDWHDYGARQLADGRFTTPDPHATKYPGTTPYACCENNPISFIDIDGKDSYYLTDGTYLFDNLKETDKIYVVDSYKNIKPLSTDSKLVVLYNKTALSDATLSAKAYSKIFTNVLTRNNFDTSKLENGQISINVLNFNPKNDGPQYQLIKHYNNLKETPWNDADVAVTRTMGEKINITANIVLDDTSNRDYFSTVSNIVSVLGIHELTGHGLLKIGSDEHWKILELQRDYPTWNKTTPKFKELYEYLEKRHPNEYIKH